MDQGGVWKSGGEEEKCNSEVERLGGGGSLKNSNLK